MFSGGIEKEYKPKQINLTQNILKIFLRRSAFL